MKNKTWVIARRELSSYFDSLIAYVLIVIFLGLSGFFTWLFGNNIFLIGQADLREFFNISYWTLFFFIPAITMRSLAEEKRAGTIELLSTKAVSDWQIVVGKFMGAFILVAVAIACTLPYYATVAYLGDIDHGATIGGYIGLALISAMYISIGIFASSTTSNQIIAFLSALFISVFFHILFSIVASNFSGKVAAVFNYLSSRMHYEALSRGVFDSRDLIYYGAIIFISLILSQSMLAKRNWHD